MQKAIWVIRDQDKTMEDLNDLLAAGGHPRPEARQRDLTSGRPRGIMN